MKAPLHRGIQDFVQGGAQRANLAQGGGAMLEIKERTHYSMLVIFKVNLGGEGECLAPLP